MVDTRRAELLRKEVTHFIDLVTSDRDPRWIVVFGSMARGAIDERSARAR